ncbi:hypothetical protein [Imhoffiella purpurea]|uniref:hypothetical protein n=1 Tax=Imhoffiella purpurea TaxID=1249627 RepID=UPI0012FE5C61|nr:hypothetical protein [Imhoffiella purpurea]
MHSDGKKRRFAMLFASGDLRRSIQKNMETLITTLIALVSAAAGFMVKSLWQAYIDRKKDIEKTNRDKNISNIEKQLEDFYWPVYLRLQKDNVVWRRILDRSSEDEGRRNIAREIDEKIIQKNHQEILNIIETKMHRACPDPQLEEQLLQYLRHVSVFLSLRSAGIYDLDPIHYDEPWPKELFALIESKTHALQQKYDALLQQ